MKREHTRVPLEDLDDLPGGPAVYVVWTILGEMYGMAGLGNRPLYVGKTVRSVKVRMNEHLRENDEAAPLIESQTEIEYFACDDDEDARALERELKAELHPFYDEE
jgi:excinuclease UvrABC nuclease subunit